MKLKFIAVILLVFATVTIGTAFFARGSVGPATVLGKEVAERMNSSVSHINAVVVASSNVSPDSIKLSWRLAAKIAVKQAVWWLELGYALPEYAVEYQVQDVNNQSKSRCMIRVFGDTVVGITVTHELSDQLFSDRLRAALAQNFPSYEIQERKTDRLK